MKKKDTINTFLGEETAFEGRLSFSGAIRIDGRFKGDISSDGMLLIGEKGRLESDIRVGRIVVSGEIHGNVTATESIEIHVPGKVYGDIQAPTVLIHEGVIFKGNCRTQAVKATEEVKLAVVHNADGPDGKEIKNAV
jgi:cytoskeletal protein CcmA (bactofilin family)